MPKTLLLADDSVTIQKVVGISFANEDVVLLTVDNGDDAVARAREARPDLVLADVMMPGKDGYEVCEAIKGDPELRHVPVLLLSGTFEPFDDERAQRAGADGHITKPFEAQSLVDQVNALLARAAEPPAPLASAGGDATVAVAGADADDAFDFFDEEMAQTAPSPHMPATTLLGDDADEAADDALELEAAVEDDEPAAPVEAEPTDALFDAPADTQATVLFEDPPPAATVRSPAPFLGDGFDAEALETAPPVAEAAPRAAYEESFDFGFEEEAAPAVASAPPAPAAAPPPPPAHEAATRLFAPEDDELAPSLAEPMAAPALPESPARSVEPPAPEAPSMPAPPPFVAPAPPPVASAPPPLPELAPPPVPETLATPPPLALTEPFAPPPVPAPPPAPAAAGREPAVGEPVAVHVSGPTALSEPIQKQLQETLEKVVWEAFGDLSERIVRDVIERVEAVAWEVIPQLAETLIREEIRRLKDDE